MSSKRYLGAPDAAQDPSLQDHFVSQADVEELLSPETHIIYGAKGVGKTAMRRAIAEIHQDRFFAAGTVDLDTLSFDKVHRDLASLSATTGEEIMALARTTWRNVLVGYCLEFVKNGLGTTLPIYDQIQGILSDEQFADRDAPGRVLNQIERLFFAVGTLGVSHSAEEPRPPLTEKQRTALDGFASTAHLAALLRNCAEVIAETGKVVAICIDGFDSIVEHEPGSRRAIFAGLIDAVHRLSRDREFNKAFCFKVFLPRELTYEAKDIAWDADKFLHTNCHLHWNEETLKEFLLKRLIRHSKSQKRTDPTFDIVWNEFMAPIVKNSFHNMDEPSFSYILRHTQFRPRQLLYHVQSLLDEWDKRSTDFRIASSFVPKIVSTASRRLSEVTVSQLEYARPGLHAFLRSWGGASSTIPFGECFSKIKRVFQLDDNIQTRRIFDELFEFGVLGVARKDGGESGGPQVKVRFSYVGDGLLTKVQPADEDVIAMCPMFSDYFACNPSRYGVVQPVAV